jgi:serine/threonine-protein kinase RsbW
VTKALPARMSQPHVFTFAATLGAFAEAFPRLRQLLADWKIDTGPAYRCQLVFEEVSVNIVKHAYRDERPHEILLTVAREPDAIVLRFEDDGIPFDPTRIPVVQSPAPPESSIGGRGLLLVGRMAHSLHYERTPQSTNRLTVRIAA